MSEEPKRRLADRLGMSPTVISESTTVVGDIETRGPLMVSGHVRGNGKIGGTLSVSKSAHWEGDISAKQGDKPKAISMLERAVAEQRDHSNAKALLSTLKS